MSRRIAAHFGSMTAIRAADAETLAAVDGIGTEKARVLVAELAELAELAPLLDRLAELGVGTAETAPAAATTGENTETAGDAGPLTGDAVVVTGSMTGALAELSRNQMNEPIERAGGTASSAVSKRTTLVAGEKAGSKRAKAEELGVRIVTPEEFADLVAAYVA